MPSAASVSSSSDVKHVIQESDIKASSTPTFDYKDIIEPDDDETPIISRVVNAANRVRDFVQRDDGDIDYPVNL